MIPFVRHITRENNAPYLDRYSLRPQTTKTRDRGWRVYLHRFLSGDDDGHHNHPWGWSFSILLRGSYTEEYFDALPDEDVSPTPQTRRVRWFNFISETRYHRITELHGKVTTLFFCGPARKSWGFWMPGRGHVPWKTRLAERGLKV